MQGGADEAIAARFSTLTVRGAEGGLDHWASDPEGRLSLVIVLEQFSRSLWRGTPRAFAQDAAALSLAMDSLENGHFQALATPWFKIACTQPLGHCEGPDHLERIDLLISLREETASAAPQHLQPIYRFLVKQAEDIRQVTNIGSDCDQLTRFNQLEASFVDLPKGFAACQFKTDSAGALAVSSGGLHGLEKLELHRRK